MFFRSRTRFRRYIGCRDPFSCFAISDSFLAVPRASVPVFMCFAPIFIFSGTEGVGSNFHILCARTYFRRYQGSRVLFSCFALPNSLSTVLSVSDPVFMFSAPGHVLGGAETVGSRFHVLHSGTLFRRTRGRRVSFSCFPRRESFSAEPRASAAVIMFCAPGHIFGGTECVGSRFHVLLARTHFQRYRGRPSRFHFLRSRTSFRGCRVRQVPFSCFVLPDSFSTVLRASISVFMFIEVPRTGFGYPEGNGTRARWVPFSCFAHRD
jgi:hypothetical protein